jgi:hypothetical protein
MAISKEIPDELLKDYKGSDNITVGLPEKEIKLYRIEK